MVWSGMTTHPLSHTHTHTFSPPPHSQDIVFYCQSGMASKKAAGLVAGTGKLKGGLFCLEGGVEGWLADGEGENEEGEGTDAALLAQSLSLTLEHAFLLHRAQAPDSQLPYDGRRKSRQFHKCRKFYPSCQFNQR